MLQGVAACCRVWQRVAGSFKVFQCVSRYFLVVQGVLGFLKCCRVVRGVAGCLLVPHFCNSEDAPAQLFESPLGVAMDMRTRCDFTCKLTFMFKT